ncbi:MAG: hypothetical protein ACREPI_01470 [Candidatus Dormibacterales bacterium]
MWILPSGSGGFPATTRQRRHGGFGVLLPLAVVLGSALLGCSGSLPFQGPSTSSVSLRAADLPGGLTRCPGSGDVGAYLAQVKKASKAAFSTALSEWNSLRSLGATGADVEVFSSDRPACSGTLGNASSSAAIAISYVVQYKDDASASRSFGQGFLQLAPKSGQQAQGLSEGSATGLGHDSWSYTQTLQGKPIFLAYWHQHSFTAFVGVANMSPSSGQKAAADMNGRLE